MNTAFLLSFLDKESVTFTRTQLDYVLGVSSNGPLVNDFPGSLVVGLGENFPRTPHHRASFCYGESKAGFQLINNLSKNLQSTRTLKVALLRFLPF